MNLFIKNYKLFVFFAILFACQQSQALDNNYESNYLLIDKKIKRKEIAEIIKLYSMPYETKYAFFETLIGKSYFNGKFLKENHQESFRLFQSASEKGFREAQFNLGLMYMDGKGVSQNNEEAIKWLTLAAEKNHIESQFQLGLLYIKINNKEKTINNEENILKWWRLATEQGHPKAKYLLEIFEKK